VGVPAPEDRSKPAAGRTRSAGRRPRGTLSSGPGGEQEAGRADAAEQRSRVRTLCFGKFVLPAVLLTPGGSE